MASELRPGVRVTDAALSQIVTLAADSVDGARVRRPKRRVEVAVEERSARVDLEVVAQYGAPLQVVGAAVQERVADALRTMCGVEQVVVDVAIEELE